MKSSLLVIAALVSLSAWVGTASATELKVSSVSLTELGYGSGQVMSDQDGSLVRGKGFYFGSMRYGHHHHHKHGHHYMQPICHTKHCFTPPACHVRSH
ncbi:MAG TPA: hypothetical protein VHV08_13585 [Pirellulales bacterium]|nr:hypothetical protein [Pirellulales bacterium]